MIRLTVAFGGIALGIFLMAGTVGAFLSSAFAGVTFP